MKGDLEEIYSSSTDTVSFGGLPLHVVLLGGKVPRGGGRIKEVYIKLCFPLTT